MLNTFFNIILLVAFVAITSRLTKYMIEVKKWNLMKYRWYIAFASPFIIIIPTVVIDNLPKIVLQIAGFIFGMSCIVFFETTRLMLEKKELKGVIYNNSNMKSKKKKK